MPDMREITDAGLFENKPSGPRGVLLSAVLAMALAGCATLRGAQDAQSAFTTTGRGESFDTILLEYAKPDGERHGMSQLAYRDHIIGLYLVDNEIKYRRFKQALIGADRESALALDILLLALSAGTALAKPEAADDWATVTALAAGARSTVDKRLFFERTMPAVVAAMDARRARIKAEITVRRRLPLAQYTLSEAMDDVLRLTDAGNIYDGIDRITATATAEKAEAQARLSAIVAGCSEAGPDTAELNSRFVRFLRENPQRQAGRVAEAAKLLDLPVGSSGPAVAAAFDDRFCGDAGKASFIDLLQQRVRELEGG